MESGNRAQTPDKKVQRSLTKMYLRQLPNTRTELQRTPYGDYFPTLFFLEGGWNNCKISRSAGDFPLVF